MENLKSIFLEEINNFRETGHKFEKGEITRVEFKGVSGGMGVYAHRSGKEFMVRLRVASGVLSKEDLNIIYNLANKYNLEDIHLTTRQAIQFHGLSIDNICDVMIEALDNNIYTRGSGGNFPRNVAISPLSGVEIGEAFDVTPYALAVNDHFMKKINTYKLPRKLKVAFSSNDDDCAHVTANDQGFLAVKKDGEKYFKLYIGGGVGRNPKLAVEFDELVKPEDVLYHIEAITNLFIAEGDYENKAKARIRYILDRMGKDEFINCYKKHLNDVIENNKESLKLNVGNVEIIKDGIEIDLKHNRLIPQKQQGLYSVYFQPIGGQLTLDMLIKLLELTNKMDNVEFRLSMEEGLYIRNLNGIEAKSILEITQGIGGETLLEQSVACIGVPTCQMGALDGQSTLVEIINLFRKNGATKNILPRVHISGCANSCGMHEIGKIGFSGKMKRVNNETKQVFELHIGGDLGIGKTKFGTCMGDVLKENVPSLLLEIYNAVEPTNLKFYTWLEDNNEDFVKIIKKYLV